MKTILSILSAALLVCGVGCVALSHHLTPAEIDTQAVQYAVEAGVAEASEFEGYGNLYKADKLKRLVDAAHQTNQFTFEQLAQGDMLKYNQVQHRATVNRQRALEMESALFAADGLLPIGLTALGASGLAGFIGLMRKRPGDYTEEELREATASQSKQFQELVIGIQGIFKSVEGISFDAPTDEDKERIHDLKLALIEKIKTILDSTQDTDTQVAVATLKKELNLS